MNFFQQIFDITDGMDMTIHVKRKNNHLTLSVFPQTTHKVAPVIITGTADELDAGFFEAIASPVSQAKGLEVNTKAFDESVQKAAEKTVKKDKPAPAAKEKAQPKKKETPAKKEKPAKQEKPAPEVTGPQEASLF